MNKLQLLAFILILMMHALAMGQSSITVYALPGQGADHRQFDSLQLPSGYHLAVINYGTPEKGMTMNSFAQSLANQIDTSKPFVLLGVSLGGMLCVELSEMLSPEKTIIISSAKNRNELPFRYKFQRIIPLHKLMPGQVLLLGAKILQPIVEPDRNKHKATFKSMLNAKSPRYMKRSIPLIINWKRLDNTSNIFHIHGDNDHTLPLRKIKNPSVVVQYGSHMMTLTRAQEISQILAQVLDL